MGTYIHLFQTESAFNQAYNGDAYLEPWASYTTESDRVDYNKTPVGPLGIPLSFDITSNGTICWKTKSADLTKTIEYSKDGGSTWTEITSSTAGTTFNVNSGDVVMFRGNNAAYGTNASNNSTFSGSTASFNIHGNIMSLINKTDFEDLKTMSADWTFGSLFTCTNVVDASQLKLPATTVTNYTYSNLFEECTSLTAAPTIEANDFTGLSGSCQNMFYECSNLLTAQQTLPAMVLGDGCYRHMFAFCSKLTTAPELPAPTLVERCYFGMFDYCSALNYVKCLATSNNTTYGTSTWLRSVSSTGTFVKAASMSWSSGTSGIPTGWTVQDA